VRLPHRLVINSWWPKFFGKMFVGHAFTAWTYMIWTCVPGHTVPPFRVWRHEERHVQQWAVLTVAVLVLFALLRLAWYAYPLAVLLAHPVAVGLAGLVATLRGGHAYRDNWFEVDARRHAGES